MAELRLVKDALQPSEIIYVGDVPELKRIEQRHGAQGAELWIGAGASLEAAPVVHVRDAEMLAALKSVHFDDLCITSALTLTDDPSPAEAFRMPETEGVGVVFEKADGTKCQRCWKILPDVGTHAHPGVCGRCDSALT